MKIKQFQKYLKKEKIDLAFLVHPDINITYFTQFKPSFSFLLITPKKTTFHLTKLDLAPRNKNICVKKLEKDWDKKFTNKKIKKIGINKSSLTMSFFEKIKKTFPKAKFIDVSVKLKELRREKTLGEEKKIAAACKITDQCFSALIKELGKKKLKTEQDVAFFLEKKMAEFGAVPSFPTIVANGKNSAIPHHQTSNQKLKRGFLLLDFGACYQNYCSDMSRVLFLGTPGKEEIERHNLLLKVQKETILELKNGRNFKEIDAFARKQLGKFSSHFIHSLGHGLGVEIHEQPNISPETEDKIKEKQIFTIEPGIYFPNKFGLRIEDTVKFSKKPVILTKSSKKLIKVRI